ncbi:MAG: hypothetical protein K0U98_27940 [Deltaproteobacteria bacterium]|nr:hypothetical protein [Deltaproteobacteria bacterium]
MAAPEYLICLECESPSYTFEWEDGKLKEILCETCGNEEMETFLSQEDLDVLEGGE